MDVTEQAQTLLSTMAGALREARIRNGDSQQEAAARVGAGLSTYRAMERGQAGVAVGHWVNALIYLGAPDAFTSALRPDDDLLALLDEPAPARPRRRRSRVSRAR